MKQKPQQQQSPHVWHSLSAVALYSTLESRSGGLTRAEAEERLLRYGHNELQGGDRVSPWSILASQFNNLLVIILLIATGLSLVLGHGVESIAIGVIVLFAVLLGFVQEYRAERAIEVLKKLAAPHAAAVRDGMERDIPARELVPGDLVLLRAGDRIPADVRLVEAVGLQVDESALTGESLTVAKTVDPLPGMDIPLGDRSNMAYSGTLIAAGRGQGMVVATGMSTEFGAIAGLLQSVDTVATPLQKNLDRVGHLLARAALVVVAVIVALGLLRGQPFIEMLIFGIALAVAVVPEALPAVVTISLAIGVRRMLARHVLIRRLAVVETLGCTSVICTDKTGTLTKNEMTVRMLVAGGSTFQVTGSGYDPVGDVLLAETGQSAPLSTAAQMLVKGGLLCSDADLVREEETQRWRITGDPTEGALVVLARKTGLSRHDLAIEYPRVREYPFSSETKVMTTVHTSVEGLIAYTKGAPEIVLSRCTRWLSAHGVRPLEERDREFLTVTAQSMAEQALRVLAVAEKRGGDDLDVADELTLLGLVGMIDPPRPEAKEAVNVCRSAGIRPVMITGDHPITALAVGRELGLVTTGRLVTGVELDRMDDQEFARSVEEIEVFARVSPAHKLRVVNALQQNGHVVAMTGDGINDAPSLKKADIGVAMGITGTDVSKEASAMILTDDNFASILAAVEEGRTVFENIKKFLMYLLSSNVGEIGLMAGAALLGYPMPLSAVQILYVNLATDGLPALALAVDPPDANQMVHPPRNPRTGMFSSPVVLLMLLGGGWSALINLGLFIWAYHSGRPLAEAMTMTFVSLALIQFIKAYNFRSDRESVLKRPFANKWLNRAVAWELLLLPLTIYLPVLHGPFGTVNLPLIDWLVILGVSLTVSPVLEIGKALIRRGTWGTT